MKKKNIQFTDAKRAAVVKDLARKEKAIQSKLKGTAKGLRGNAKQLAELSEEKQSAAGKLAATAGNLRGSAKRLATISDDTGKVKGELSAPAARKPKGGIDPTIEVASLHRKAERLATIDRRKKRGEGVLKVVDEEKEGIMRGLVKTIRRLTLEAKQLAAVGKENEIVKRRLAAIARQKEAFRRKLALSAESLRRKAKQLAVIAHDNEKVRRKLVFTAKSLRAKAKRLAGIAKENESIKRKLAATAVEKEAVRRELVVTAEGLRLKAKQLAATAMEREAVRLKLAAAAENLRRKADNLAQLKANYEATFSSVGEGLVVTDASGKIRLANQAFEKMSGWREKQALGKSFTEILPMLDKADEVISVVERPITKALGEHVRVARSDVKYVRRDASSFPIALTIEPIVVRKNFIGTVSVLRDITKENDIDRAKTEFVSLASHQLRTPLTAVNWYTEMLLQGDAGEMNEMQKKYLDKVYNNNQRMVALVDALLNVSRLELGTFTIEPEPTDVARIARKSIEEMRFLTEQRRIKLESRYAEGLPALNTDPKLFGIVLHNLLSNAVKYTPTAGKIGLELRFVKKGEAVDTRVMTDDSIVLIVKDTGYGIPANQHDKIFMKLFRADNVKEMNTEGTGLGLYMVKSIVDRSGGDVWFRSKVNKGTTFFVALPLAGMRKKDATTPESSNP